MTTEPAPYLRIAEHLRALITSGQLAAGDRMPPISEVRAQFNVAGSVVGRAYGVLIDDGLVISRHGAGYYVRAAQPVDRLVRRHQRATGDDSPVAAAGAAQGVEITWDGSSTPTAADERIAGRLGVEAGAPVMHTRYVYRADGVPVQLAESWEPMAITGSSLIVMPEAGPHAGRGVAARMRVIGIDVDDPVERVRARGATRAEATALGVAPSAPVLAIERTYYDQESGRPVETADIVLRGDRWEAVYGAQPSRRS